MLEPSFLEPKWLRRERLFYEVRPQSTCRTAVAPFLLNSTHFSLIANAPGPCPGPEALALQLERQPRLAPGQLAIRRHRALARRLRAEGDGQLAVGVREDRPLGRIDDEDRVVKRQRVLRDAMRSDKATGGGRYSA